MKKILPIILAMLLVVPISGCKSKKNSIHAIKYNLDAEPTTLDPQAANDFSSNTVILNIFEGLTRLDKNENATLACAEKLESNHDSTIFTVYIRKNSTWGNKEKTPLTSKDFVFGLKRALDKNTNCPLVSNFYCIKNAKNFNLNNKNFDSVGIEIIDDYTIKFSLEESNQDFPKVLALPAAMPCNENFFNSCAGQYGLSHTTVLCNGPFKVKPKYGWEHFKSLNLIKNENYSGPNQTNAEGINFTIGQDTSNLTESIKNEVLDAGLLPFDEIKKAQDKNLTLLPFNDIIWCISFNCSNETFSSLNMRKAILSSLNREFILNSIPEDCSIANDLVPIDSKVGTSNFRDSSNSNLFFKEDNNSLNYLKAGLSELNLKEMPNITITCLDTSEVKSIISNMLENLNQKLDAHLNMNPVSYKDLLSTVNNLNYQIALVPIVVDTSSAFDFLNMFKSDSKSNFPKYKNSNYDKLLNSAKISNSKDSLHLLQEAEKSLLSQCVLYPMYTQKQFFSLNPKLKNIIVHKYKAGIDFTRVEKA